MQDGLHNYKDIDISFIISGDHSTPCIKKAHTDDPIPLVVSGNNIEKDGTSRFTESYSKKGDNWKNSWIRGNRAIFNLLRRRLNIK